MNQIVPYLLALNTQRQNLGENWRVFAETDSIQSTWAFDRFRIGSPSTAIEVAVFQDSDLVAGDFDIDGSNIHGDYPIILNSATNTAVDVQPFSQDADFEHSFTFDLSGTSGKKYIAIRNLAGICYQIYCYPTGFSATRNKDAELTAFYEAALNGVKTWSGSFGRIRLDNQTLQANAFKNWIYTEALEIRLDNSTMVDVNPINEVLQAVDAAETTNGIFTFTGLSYSDTTTYDTLITKGWTLT